MSVYVDEPIFPFGRMMMCHMVADTREELVAMADKIRVGVWHIQKLDTPNEHFDICKSKRALAIKAGAKAVDSSTIVNIIRIKRERVSPTDSDPRRLCCDECFDISVLYGPVGLGEQHVGCGGYYRLIDLRVAA